MHLLLIIKGKAKLHTASHSHIEPTYKQSPVIGSRMICDPIQPGVTGLLCVLAFSVSK